MWKKNSMLKAESTPSIRLCLECCGNLYRECHLQTTTTSPDKVLECVLEGIMLPWPQGRDQMGPNSSFLLLISMIILNCHMAYVFFFFNLRQNISQWSDQVLMKGIFHELYLFGLDISHPASSISCTWFTIRLEEVYGERSSTMHF